MSSELDRQHLIIDRDGVAHAVALTQVDDAERPVRWWTWCRRSVVPGEDVSYVADCRECEDALRAWRRSEEVTKELADERKRAREAAERARDLRRKR